MNKELSRLLIQVCFAVFAPLSPQSKPHSKTTATAVHLLFANALAQDNAWELDRKRFYLRCNSKYIYYFCACNFLTDI